MCLEVASSSVRARVATLPTSAMRTLALSSLLASGLLLVACGGSTSSSASGTPAANADAGSGSQGGDGAAAGDDGGSPAPAPAPPSGASMTSIGTYIVLGDSISDRGGAGPFFYDLLYENDDATYPTWKGHDLATRFPGIQYVHAAVAGSITGAYGDALTAGAPLLSDQIKGLGSSYPGNVLVTITIGGNDLNDHAGDAVTGLDAPDKQKFAANLKADLDALTAPGRLGSGKVFIVEANIYDASDGQGDWKTGGPRCPPYNVAGSQDTMVFSAWNQIVASAIAAYPGVDTPLDLHTLFAGHGFNSTDDWYYSDCIHPNQKGHQELRREAWRLVTGEQKSD